MMSSIQYGQKYITVRVERTAETTRKDEAATLYTLIGEEAREREDDGLGF